MCVLTLVNSHPSCACLEVRMVGGVLSRPSVPSLSVVQLTGKIRSRKGVCARERLSEDVLL